MGGDISVLYGLQAAPASFRSVVTRFVQGYTGTPAAPVPFGGRATELRRLNEWLAEESGPANLLVTAPAGRGKTALLVRWIAQVDPAWPVAFVPISIRAETNRPTIFYQALACGLAAIAGKPISSIPVGDPALFYKERVIELFDEIAASGKRCLVVIDGLDEASGWSVDATVLPPHPPAGIRVVASARLLAGDEDDTDWRSRLGWLGVRGAVTGMTVKPLDRDGVADVLTRMEFPLGKLGSDVDIVERLHHLTEGGDPLLLTLYVHDLLERGDAAGGLTPDDLLRMKPGYGYYFDRWFEQLERTWTDEQTRVDPVLVDAVMVVLACAQGPVSLRTLEALLARVYPGERIVSEGTLRPVRRFVMGDGASSGYVLSHPKLADYLRNERFAGGTIVDRTRRHFVEWGQDVVRTLNAGAMAPEAVPRYALLHHVHHLEQLDPRDALELYPELLEEGWKRAWNAHEGGHEGFSRDVALAWRAMRRVAQGCPEQLRAPLSGLGGQMRCVLILSSIRSAGFETPAPLLAELLADGLISPRQALHLVRLKPGEKRGDALHAIAGSLPADLLAEAEAIGHEIGDLAQRARGLLAVGRRLAEGDRRRVAGDLLRLARGAEGRERAQAVADVAKLLRSEDLLEEAFEVACTLPGGYGRSRVLDEVECCVREVFPQGAPAEWGARLVAARAFSEDPAGETQESDPPPAPVPAHPENQAGGEWFDPFWMPRDPTAPPASAEEVTAALAAGVRDPALATWRLYDRLDWFVGGEEMFFGPAPAPTEEQLWRITSAVLSNDDWIRRLHFLEHLAPHLPPTVAERVLTWVLTRDEPLLYETEQIAGAVAPRLTARQIERALGSISPEEWSRGYLPLLTTLPDEPLAAKVAALLDEPGTLDVAELVTSAGSRLPDEVLERLLTVADATWVEWRKRDALRALASVLPERLLPAAARAAAKISSQDMRGDVLLALLPRVRGSGGISELKGLQETAFLVHDGSVATMALAALHGRLPAREREWVIDAVLAQVARIGSAAEPNAVLEASVALALLAHGGAPPVPAAVHSLLPRVREQTSEGVGWAAQALLASVAGDAAAMSSVVEGSPGAERDAPSVLLLAAVLSPASAPAARALSMLEEHPDTDAGDTKLLKWIPRALAASAELRDTATSFAALGEEIRAVRLAGDEGKLVWISVLLAAWALVPYVPEGEPRRWFAEVDAVVGADADEFRILRFFAPWVPDAELLSELDGVLDLAADSFRSQVLGVLCISEGAVGQILRSNPRFAAEPVPGPLERLGGEAALVETARAIRDVISWWP